MKMEQISFWVLFPFLLDIPVLGLLGHGASIFNVWGTLVLLKIRLYQFTLLLVVCQVPFSISLPSHVISHSDRYELFHCGFNLHSPQWLVMLGIFSCTFGYLYILWKRSIQVLWVHFKLDNCFFFFFCNWVYEFLYFYLLTS